MTLLLPLPPDWKADLTEIRRAVHRNPELSRLETGTAALVADRLRRWGADQINEQIGGTGVVGVIRGSVTARR